MVTIITADGYGRLEVPAFDPLGQPTRESLKRDASKINET
jgi:hypothetical protein